MLENARSTAVITACTGLIPSTIGYLMPIPAKGNKFFNLILKCASRQSCKNSEIAQLFLLFQILSTARFSWSVSESVLPLSIFSSALFSVASRLLELEFEDENSIISKKSITIIKIIRFEFIFIPLETESDEFREPLSAWSVKIIANSFSPNLLIFPVSL